MDDIREFLSRRLRPVTEGATHVVASSVPGLRFETTKEESGYTVRVIHAKSGKLLWTTNVDRIPKEKLDTSLKALDRVWAESGVNWDVEAEELTGQKNLGSVVSGITKSIDQSKKPIKHNDPNEPILGKLVYYESKEPTMDKRSLFERMDEARVGKPRVAKGLQEANLSNRNNMKYFGSEAEANKFAAELRKLSGITDVKVEKVQGGAHVFYKHLGVAGTYGKDVDPGMALYRKMTAENIDKEENAEVGYGSTADLQAEGVQLENIASDMDSFVQHLTRLGWKAKINRKEDRSVWMQASRPETKGGDILSAMDYAITQWKKRSPDLYNYDVERPGSSSQVLTIRVDQRGGKNEATYTKPKKPAAPPSADSDGLDKADGVDENPGDNPTGPKGDEDGQMSEGQDCCPKHKAQQNESRLYFDGNSIHDLAASGRVEVLPRKNRPLRVSVKKQDGKYVATLSSQGETGSTTQKFDSASPVSLAGSLNRHLGLNESATIAAAEKERTTNAQKKRRNERTTPSQNARLYESMGNQRNESMYAIGAGGLKEFDLSHGHKSKRPGHSSEIKKGMNKRKRSQDKLSLKRGDWDEASEYESGCKTCGKKSGVKDGQCKNCRDVASMDEGEILRPEEAAFTPPNSIKESRPWEALDNEDPFERMRRECNEIVAEEEKGRVCIKCHKPGNTHDHYGTCTSCTKGALDDLRTGKKPNLDKKPFKAMNEKKDHDLAKSLTERTRGAR